MGLAFSPSSTVANTFATAAVAAEASARASAVSAEATTRAAADITLTNDLGGTLAAPAVVQITGAAGILPIIAAQTVANSGVATAKAPSIIQTLATADATPTNFATALNGAAVHPDGYSVDYAATVIGRNLVNGDTYRVDLASTYQRFGGGAPTLVGLATVANAKNNNTAPAAWAAVMIVSGNNVLIQVTGQAATNITWSCMSQAQFKG